MTTPPGEPFLVEGLPDLWQSVGDAKHLFLGLDYDGTLAPFRTERLEAVPFPGTIEIIQQIRMVNKCVVAFISGRPVSEIIRLTGESEIPIAGSHGAEILIPGQELIVFTPTPDQIRILDAAEELARRENSPEQIERKVSSVALHTRGVPEETARRREQTIFKLWSELGVADDMECRYFQGGVELRIAALNKGKALKYLLGRQPARTFAVYLGDDETDEDAFREISPWGVGIKIAPGNPPTLARGRLRNCASVLAFLKTWLEVIMV